VGLFEQSEVPQVPLVPPPSMAPILAAYVGETVPPPPPFAAEPPMRSLVAPPSLPAPGSAEMPTVGSAGHWTGSCKPCAFLHTKGCSNGVMCQFCHLCDQDEKQRRKKEKRNTELASKTELR